MCTQLESERSHRWNSGLCGVYKLRSKTDVGCRRGLSFISAAVGVVVVVVDGKQ